MPKGEEVGSGNKYAYPLESGSGFDGGVSDHMSRAFGNWQSDNAVDILCSNGTEVRAVAAGKIGRVTIDTSYDPGGNPNGSSVYLMAGGEQFWYTHMIDVFVKEGDDIEAGGAIGKSGTANGVPHLHFAAEPPLNPEEVVTGAEITSGGTAPGGSTTTSGVTSGFSEEDLFSVTRAGALSTFFELPGMLNLVESSVMRGAKSIYNDEPLLDFVEQVNKGSMRHFQSLPNGAFFSFFPDQFGIYKHRKPYWSISDVEIIDGKIDLNDDALATHVFVVGDTVNPDGAIDIFEQLASKGVITIFDAFTSAFMIQKGKEPKEEAKDRQTDIEKTKGFQDAYEFLKKYGVRPHYEEALTIRNPYFEMFYAFTQFQLLWSSQYQTEFSFTFMPELYPGGIVELESHDIQCYVDSVTHSFDYESGFTTQAMLSAPSARKNSPLAEHMVHPFTIKNRPLEDGSRK